MSQVNGRLGLHERSARDFFDALVAQRLLHRDEGGRYGNSEEAAKVLDPANQDYIGGFIEMMNARLYGFWGSLTEGLRSGEPQNEMKPGETTYTPVGPSDELEHAHRDEGRL